MPPPPPPRGITRPKKPGVARVKAIREQNSRIAKAQKEFCKEALWFQVLRILNPIVGGTPLPLSFFFITFFYLKVLS